MKKMTRTNGTAAGIRRQALVILLALTLVFQYSAFGLTAAWAAETEESEAEVILQEEESTIDNNEEIKEEIKEEVKEEVQQEAPAEEIKAEAPAEEVKEEVKQEAPAEEIKAEAPAEEVKEEVQQEAPAEEIKAEAPAEEVKEEIKQEAPAEEEQKAEAPAKEDLKVEAPVKELKTSTVKTAASASVNAATTKAPTYSITYHFFQMDSNGEYVEAKAVKRSVTSGKSTANIAISTATSYVTNKTVEVNGKSLKYINAWTYENGSAVVFPLTRSYEEAAELVGEGTTADINVYAQYRGSAKLTFHYDDVRQTNGTMRNFEISNTLSWGSGSSIGRKNLESTTGLRSGQTFSVNGHKYTYTGLWNSSLGVIVDENSKLTFKVGDQASADSTYYFTEDMDVYFTPIYEEESVKGYRLSYIDNVSTGSTSFSNIDSNGNASEFSSHSKVFRQPDSQPHYQFVYWLNPETEKTYVAGDKYSMNYKDLTEELTIINIYAIWQPSVTVNYNVLGRTAKQTESFESVAAYGFIPEAKDANTQFEGWYDEEGNRIDDDTVYAAPEATGISEDVNKPEVVNVYARFNTTHTVKKVWDDQGREDSLRAENIEAALIADGEETEQEVTLSDDNNWTYTFEDLDAYKNNKLINYTSDELTEFGTEYDKEIATADGTTTITNVFRPTITLTAASDSWMYDGEEHSNEAVELTEGSLYEGDRLEASAEGTVKNVTDTEEGNNIVAEYRVLRGEGENAIDVTAKYNIETVAGTLEITPRTVILTSMDASKEFDGEALVNEEVEISGDGFCEGEGAEYHFAEGLTEVGTMENAFEYTLNENTEEENYEIETVFGTLTVEEAPVIEPEPEEEPEAEADQPEAKNDEPAAPENKEEEPKAVEEIKEAPAQEEQKDEAPIAEIEGPAAEPDQAAAEIEAPGAEIKDADVPETAADDAQEAEEETEHAPEAAAEADDEDDEVIVPAASPVRPQPVGPAANIVSETPEAPAAPVEEAEIAEIEGAETPLTVNETEEILIEEAEAPTSGFAGSWALINLLEVAATCLVSALLLVLYFIKRRDEENVRGAEFQAAEGGQKESEKWNRKGLIRLLAIIPAIASVVIFILTEDMTQQMAMTDRWTLIMTVLLIAEAVMAILCRKTREEADEQ